MRRHGASPRAGSALGPIGVIGAALLLGGAPAWAAADGEAGVARSVVQLQAWLDPAAPWLLGLLVVLAWVSARHARRAAPRWPRPRVGRWALVLAAVLGVSAAALSGVIAHGGHPLQLAWDQAAAEWGAALRAQGWREPAQRLGSATDVLPMTALVVLVGAWLWARGAGALAWGWLLATSINSLWIRVLKAEVARPRPGSAGEALVSGFSFPSGHTTATTLVLGLLCWLLCRRAPRGVQRLVVPLAVALIACVAASRVVLGVHHGSDVLAGWLLSATVMAAGWGALAWLGVVRNGQAQWAPRARPARSGPR